jgi:molecular chaperone GrpE (heat shock protein)
MLDVENHYESWVSGLMILDAGRRIQEMDRFYTKLFQKKPVYKCKKKSRRYRAMAIKHKTEKELIRDLQAENARLKAELMRAQANMDYLSIMMDAYHKNLWKEGIEDV